jgi:hypothetical protein
MKEITYDQAAVLLRCSPRNVRRLIRRHNIDPIVRGHRTVRLDAGKITRLSLTIMLNGRKHTNGGCR